MVLRFIINLWLFDIFFDLRLYESHWFMAVRFSLIMAISIIIDSLVIRFIFNFWNFDIFLNLWIFNLSLI